MKNNALSKLAASIGLRVQRLVRLDPPWWHFWNPMTGYAGGVIMSVPLCVAIATRSPILAFAWTLIIAGCAATAWVLFLRLPNNQAEPEYRARRGWKLSPTGRAVLRTNK